jgi:hypothetical protein
MLNETLETFAREQGLVRALAFYLGGSADGSKRVVGPEAVPTDAVVPIIHVLTGARETLAQGTLLPNEAGEPSLHMRAAAGQEGRRRDRRLHARGIAGTAAHRETDSATGFELLTFG